MLSRINRPQMRLRLEMEFLLADPKDKMFQVLEEAQPPTANDLQVVRQYLSDVSFQRWFAQAWQAGGLHDSVIAVKLPPNATDAETAALFRAQRALVAGYKGAVQMLLDLAYDKSEEEENLDVTETDE